MIKNVFFTTALCLSVAGLFGCGGEQLGPVQDLGGTISAQAPSAWKSVPPDSPLRLAQYLLPKGNLDREDATLVVYYFGQGEGGGVEENLERWYGQFQQPDGGSTRDRARVSRRTVSGMPVTVADVSGTYTQTPMTPMMMAHGPEPKPDYRMLAAIVETPRGSFFFKLTGPARTVEQWRKSFEGFIDRIKKK